MRILVSLATLLVIPAAFGQLWYSNPPATPCCVLAATNGAFYVVSGGQGITVSAYSEGSSSSSTSISSAKTPMAAVLNGPNVLVAGAAGNATGFVSSTPAAGLSAGVPWNKTLGTAAGGALTGIAVGPDGGIWVTGYTKDPNYPVTSDAYQRTGPTPTTFGTPSFGVLTKLSADGQKILYSTFLGDGASACTGGSRCIGVFGNTMPVALQAQQPLPTFQSQRMP